MSDRGAGMLGAMWAGIGIVIALAAIGIALPAELAPWAAHCRSAWGLSGWWWPLIVAGLLALAGCFLPAHQKRPAMVDHTGLTVALLFLLEPLLHLAVLAASTIVDSVASAEALLPLAPPPLGEGVMVRLMVYAVLVPMGEEFFFRGRLLPWLRLRLGAMSAITISAGFFAVAHGDLIQALIALPVGLLLGIMRVAGAGLGACMVAHGVHNALILLAGPGLIALPLAAPTLILAGGVVAAASWYFHVRSRPGQWRRFIISGLVVSAVVVVLAPGWQALQDAWWAKGVHRLCVRWRIDTSDLLARVVAQERQGGLTAKRRRILVEALQAHPCQTHFRQVGLMALLDPQQVSTVTGWEDAAYELCDHLAARSPVRYDGEIARRIGVVMPSAIADTILSWPEVLPRWWPLPERTREAALLIAACQEIRGRRVLLTQMEARYPGNIAAVILAMPREYLTSTERRHLRLHYADADLLLAAVAATDPQLAIALGWVP